MMVNLQFHLLEELTSRMADPLRCLHVCLAVMEDLQVYQVLDHLDPCPVGSLDSHQ